MVQKIDEALIRKRSEHNDGIISTLKEITLHQFDIEKIENLEIFCKNLEILFLQSNQISKIENLSKLKNLNYLQLALNNITRIENLQGCESLSKLDLTVNFIKDLSSVETLQENEMLRHLYLTGNPCTEVPGYRYFVIATLPQLTYLDGIEITKTERIKASHEYEKVKSRVEEIKEQEKRGAESGADQHTETLQDTTKEANQEQDEEELDRKRKEFQTKIVHHTPASRLETARDLEAMRHQGKPPAPKKEKKDIKMYADSDGRVLQCNHAKVQYKIKETKTLVQICFSISKFLDTSLIEVKVEPDFIEVMVKGKMVRLVFESKVECQDYICERSKITGELVVTLKKVDGNETKMIRELVDSSEIAKVPIDRKVVKQTESLLNQSKKSSELADYRNIMSNAARNTKTSRKETADTVETRMDSIFRKEKGGIGIKEFSRKNVPSIEMEISKEFVDDSDVPPLC